MKKLFLMICLSSLLLSACGKQEEPKSQLVVPIVTAPVPMVPSTEPAVIPESTTTPTTPSQDASTKPAQQPHSGMIDEDVEFCTVANLFGIYGFLSVDTYGELGNKDNFSQAYAHALANQNHEQLKYLQSQKGLTSLLIPYAVTGSANRASFDTLYGHWSVEMSLDLIDDIVSKNSLTLKEQRNYSVFTGGIYQQGNDFVYLGTTPGGVTVKFTTSAVSELISVLPEITVMETKSTSTIDFDEYLNTQDLNTSTFLTLPEDNIFIQYNSTNQITGYVLGEKIIFDRDKFHSLFTLSLCPSLDRELNEQFLKFFGFKMVRTHNVTGFLLESPTPIFYGFDNDTGVSFMVEGRGDSELLLNVLQKTDIKNAYFD